MLTVFIISLIIFLTYVVSICVLYGSIPSSISESYYILEKRKKGLGWLFTLFCYSVLFTAVPLMFEITERLQGEYHFIALFAGFGLGLVGAAPHFKNVERVIHYVGAIMCMVSSLLWCYFTIDTIPIIAIVVASIVTASISYKGGKNLMFWIEMIVFATTYITLALCIH